MCYEIFKNVTIEEIVKSLYEYNEIGTIEELRKMKEKVNKNKWIPCSERLPDSTFNMEVTTESNEREIAYYSRYEGNWYSPITNDVLFVKAWKEPSSPWEDK